MFCLSPKNSFPGTESRLCLNPTQNFWKSFDKFPQEVLGFFLAVHYDQDIHCRPKSEQGVYRGDFIDRQYGPCEELLEKYFDVENLTYWMAFQLLTGNCDTQSRNMYLYSPQNLDTWYLLDWDNDSMLNRTERSLRNYTDGLS